MAQLNLILTLPQGANTATSLGVEGFAWHRSPGSGKYFLGRSVYIDLALKDGKPDFKYLPEGGWRDSDADTGAALDSVSKGKRTKTAISNNSFSCTPIDSYRRIFLGKTGGELLELEKFGELARFKPATVNEGMAPDQIAQAIGLPAQPKRVPRLYMVLAPLEFMLLSNLTPEEYVWYATHRPGKKFRQVLFTELRSDQSHLAAERVYESARAELTGKDNKKTKTIVTGECLNRIPYTAWVGYDREAPGGIYAGDQEKVMLWRFPERIPRNWERAAG
jgi:hypothetical protein